MPTYTVTDPTTRKSVRLTGDSPPTEAELNGIFAQMHGAATPPAPTGALAAQLARTDLPDDVRAELQRQGGPDQMRSILTPTGARPILNGLLAPVRAWGAAGPHRVVTGLREAAGGQFSRGANDIINGATVTALPMVAPALLPAIAAAPGAAALTLGAGAAAQAVAPPVARALGASPDQADLAGTLAGAGAGTVMATLGVPALAKWSTNNKAAAMGRDYYQSTRDIQAALGVKAEDVHLARPFLEAVHAQSIPIAGKEEAAAQLTKAGDAAIAEIEDHISGIVQQFPTARVNPSQWAIYRKVANMPGASAKDMASAQAVVKEYALDQPRSLADAEDLRVRLNAENRATLESTGVRQRNAAMTNPAYVARQQAANSLRDGIYDTLEQRGVQGIRDLRRSEGAVIALRNAAEKLTSLKGEATVARTGNTSIPRRILKRTAEMMGAGAGAFAMPTHPVFGAMGGAEIAGDLASGLVTSNMSKNALLERAFRQSFTSPPVMSVQGVRVPPTGLGLTVPPQSLRMLPPKP